MGGEGEQWPPVWKPIEECPEYEYIAPYIEEWPIEHDDNAYFHYRDRVPIETFKMFLETIRESRVYDVTQKIPIWWMKNFINDMRFQNAKLLLRKSMNVLRICCPYTCSSQDKAEVRQVLMKWKNRNVDEATWVDKVDVKG
ncbi:hypothetical protein C2S51_033174 [Perilla frutescens var. frutescens]|nr:hypothetical protein C2S51_033174 [Perilla frutescens var. frutescens]